MWFCGAHSDVGGSYKPSKDGSLASDYPLQWMMKEALLIGLETEAHLHTNLNLNPLSPIHNSRRSFYREIQAEGRGLHLHPWVKKRWDADERYRPDNLQVHINKYG